MGGIGEDRKAAKGTDNRRRHLFKEKLFSFVFRPRHHVQMTQWICSLWRKVSFPASIMYYYNNGGHGEVPTLASNVHQQWDSENERKKGPRTKQINRKARKIKHFSTLKKFSCWTTEQQPLTLGLILSPLHTHTADPFGFSSLCPRPMLLSIVLRPRRYRVTVHASRSVCVCTRREYIHYSSVVRTRQSVGEGDEWRWTQIKQTQEPMHVLMGTNK